MHTDAKVVPLGKPAADGTAVGRLPLPLIQLRDYAAQNLRSRIAALFDKADDSLFEMADKAGSNAEQNAYFEAMRDLRLKRKGIERSFLQTIFDGFARLNKVEIGRPAKVEAVSMDSLTLVQNDALEESVAVDTMVSKVMGRDAAGVTHLTTRLNTLISKKLDDKTNPLGPQALCEAFLAGCQSLGVEIKVKLIILKLFEKHVLGDISELYAEANQLLIKAGVLPELKSQLPKPKRPAAAPQRPALAVDELSDEPDWDDNGAVAADQGHAFMALQNLMAQVRGLAFPQRAPQQADAVPVSSRDLTRLLSFMQQRHQQFTGDSGELRDQLEGLIAKASAKSGKNRAVGQVDDDAINLVSMLFDFILDDRNLSDGLKALIGRLQIPMIKVAVIDKSFFNRGGHPARRLLNEIASAALGWSGKEDSERDALYQKIETIVQRLLKDFDDDPQIFNELLADFLNFVGDEKRRSELLEQRTRDAEEGRARSQIAREKVEELLNMRLVGRSMPELVLEFLKDAWSKVLLLAYLKHGMESEPLKQSLDTMEQLIWSVQPDLSADERRRLVSVVPGLLKALREGLEEAAYDPFATSEFFTKLEVLHMQLFTQHKKALERKAEPQPEPLAADEQLLDVPVLQAELSSEFLSTPAVEALVEAPAPEEDVDAPVMVEVVEEIVLASPQETAPKEAEEILDADDESLAQVDALHVGAWVELQEDEEHRLRCKLAAVIKPTGKYVFVNRTGMKVLEKTRMGLAIEFRRASIRVLNDNLLFDRALESVIGNLRRLKDQA